MKLVITESQFRNLVKEQGLAGGMATTQASGGQTYTGAPTGEKIPMPNAVPPADQAIANQIYNNTKTQADVAKIMSKIKTPQQFLNVSNGIKIATNNTTYGLIELINRYKGAGLGLPLGQSKGKADPATKQITDYLTKIGVNTQTEPNGQITFRGFKVAAPKMQWKPETGRFPLMLGQYGKNIQALQKALGLKGDSYFGPATEKYILAKAPEYKRVTGVTQQIYNKIVPAAPAAQQPAATAPEQPTIAQLQASPNTLNPY